VRIDAAEEVRLLEYGQRLVQRSRAVLAAGPGASTGETLLAASLAGGAQALGQPAPALAVGQVADLVSLDPAHPALAGHQPDSAIDAWILPAAAAQSMGYGGAGGSGGRRPPSRARSHRPPLSRHTGCAARRLAGVLKMRQCAFSLRHLPSPPTSPSMGSLQNGLMFDSLVF
jgi:hypothetical protein